MISDQSSAFALYQNYVFTHNNKDLYRESDRAVTGYGPENFAGMFL